MDRRSSRTIFSLEQALTLPYATQRFVQLGWRVVRIEYPRTEGDNKAGDPNRHIGEDTGIDDLRAYFLAPNVGKEAITLNLKKSEGRELLKTLIRRLEVDVFLCNTLPKRYEELGIGYENLKEANSELIWCGISALGPEYPDRAGYDPAMQALLGYMFLTGEPDRDPMLCGLPIIDLKAGDEAFAQVLLALLERQNGSHEGGGKEIHISMAQCAASWLITALPQLEFVDDASRLFTRSGNEHRSFIPSNCYPAKDGYVYLAIGNDTQWEKLTRMSGFHHLHKEERKTNQGRMKEKEQIYSDIREGLRQYTVEEFIEACLAQNLPVAPINSIQEVAELDCVKTNMVTTHLPDAVNGRVGGKRVALYPAAVRTEFLSRNDNTLRLAPRLGEHNEPILREAGLTTEEIETLRANEVI